MSGLGGESPPRLLNLPAEALRVAVDHAQGFRAGSPVRLDPHEPDPLELEDVPRLCGGQRPLADAARVGALDVQEVDRHRSLRPDPLEPGELLVLAAGECRPKGPAGRRDLDGELEVQEVLQAYLRAGPGNQVPVGEG